VTFLYRITAVDNTSKESSQSQPASASYTYQELLLGAANQNKSVSAGTTTTNGQRKLVRESSGKLHEVFESGSQIFYRNSSDGGATWQTTLRLTDGYTTNAYPCIAERSGNVYAVWQKQNTSSWDLAYSYSTNGGTTWLSQPSILVSYAAILANNPLPVIFPSSPSSSFQLMVAYRQASGINTMTTLVSPGSSGWSSPALASGTNSNSKNPTLDYTYSWYYYKLLWDESGKIYYENYMPGGSWSGLTFVNSGNNQPITVIHYHMAHEGKLGFLSFPLSIEPSFRIGRRLVSIVRSLFSMKINRRIAWIIRSLICRCVFLDKTLLAGPRLNQRPINRKVLVTDQIMFSGQTKHLLKEFGGNIGFQETIPVLAEHRVIPHTLIHRETDKPSKQKIIAQLLDQQTFTANRIENLYQRCSQKILRWYRWSSYIGIHLVKLRRQLLQKRIDHLSQLTQRVIFWNTIFLGNITEHWLLSLLTSAHTVCLSLLDVMNSYKYNTSQSPFDMRQKVFL
jgi:hypothetical protein